MGTHLRRPELQPVEIDHARQRAEAQAGVASAAAGRPQHADAARSRRGHVPADDPGYGARAGRRQRRDPVALSVHAVGSGEPEDGPRAARRPGVRADLRSARRGAERADRRAGLGPRDCGRESNVAAGPLSNSRRAARRRQQGHPGRDGELQSRRRLHRRPRHRVRERALAIQHDRPPRRAWRQQLERPAAGSAERRIGLAPGYLRPRAST